MSGAPRVFRRKAAPLLDLSPSAFARFLNSAAVRLLVVKHRLPGLRAVSVPILLRGHRPFWISDRSELLVLKDVYVDGSYAEDCLPGDARTIVDLGANAGLASRFFRSRYPTARIVAYEASARTAALARRNMRGDPRFELQVTAVAGESGTVSLHQEPGDSWSSRIGAASAGDENLVTAESLDSIVRRHSPIDVLKVDIEGAEYAAFESCDALGDVALILGEIHASEDHSPEDFRALLHQFEVLRWDLVDGTGPFVARRRDDVAG